MKRIALLAGCLLFVSCGGGGGESAGACSSIKINAGESCNAGEPSVAYLLLNKSNGKTFSCTGTYISQTAVLTAAHCLEGVNSITVASLGYARRARAVYIHPQYNGRVTDGSDLAIVLVSEPIQAAPVPLLVSAGPPGVGEELVAYGYGTDENGRGTPDRIANGEASLKATFIAFAASLGGRFYQTASTEDGTTCEGDSGGPILAKNANGEYGIIAVTSFGTTIDENGCTPIAKGTLSVESPIQNNSAMNFILTYAPDAARN